MAAVRWVGTLAVDRQPRNGYIGVEFHHIQNWWLGTMALVPDVCGEQGQIAGNVNVKNPSRFIHPDDGGVCQQTQVRRRHGNGSDRDSKHF
jgi:hypothetical protein